ncbi:heavy-metal-associated domain-containing protein [Candidatus Chrysopegis kryptomonas]|uniref:Copper ion binding protein n=1 Tax=Candidatus Chryseopegocella kryptomonas TaxID=1633643 RepID=A0A0N7MYX1_9BACT|nr:copper ion binding protein [Candidatus Chrysopegis kryptomonas]CUT05427.1 copper ion binding protein [Candidatus Chrysopegis kryptomonas]
MKKLISVLAIIFLISPFAISQEKSETVKFKVKGVTCDHCVGEVKEALVNVNGVNSVEFEETNFKNSYGVVRVSYNPNKVNVDKLVEAVSEAGFEPDLKQQKKETTKTEKVEGSVVKINVKGIECGGCVKSVENSLKKVDGVKSVEFEKKDYKKQFGVVKVVYDPAKVKVSDLEDAIVKVGFTANDKKPKDKHKEMEH